MNVNFQLMEMKANANWVQLNVGTVPTFKMHHEGTVPTYKMHHVGTLKKFKF